MKNTALMLLFFFLGTVNGKAQNPFLDSLKMVVDTLPNSKEKVEHLLSISTGIYSGEESAKYGLLAIQEAQKFGDLLLLADAYLNMAAYYNVLSNVDSFNLFTNQAEQKYKDLNDNWGLASIYKMRGDLFGKFKQNKVANENFQIAFDYAQKANHDRIKVDILNDWGIFLRTAKNYDASIQKLKEGIKINEKGNLANSSRLYFNLGRTFQENQQFDQAILFQKKAFHDRVELQIGGGIAESLIQFLRLNADIEKADQDTMKFHNTIKELGYPHSHAMLDSLSELAKIVNHSGVWEMFYKVSHRYHESKGNYQKALVYYQKGHRMQDSLILTQKNIKAVADLNLKYNNEVLQNEVLRAQISETESTNQRNIVLLLLFTAILLAILGGLYFRQRLAARNIALQFEAQKVEDLKKQQQLIAMNAMLEGQEKERSRIAKDLHDGLGNMLTTIKYQIAGLSLDMGNKFGGIQHKAENMIDEACSEVRKIAHDMMPIALKKLGLNQALEDLCEKQNAHQDYEVIFQSFGRIAKLTPNVATMLYRISQEIFNNINKHAEPTEVVVQMTYSEDWLTLTFEDDGKGFDLQKVMEKGGIGLHSIQSRVSYLAGECLIDSRINEGTNFNINIPLK